MRAWRRGSISGKLCCCCDVLGIRYILPANGPPALAGPPAEQPIVPRPPGCRGCDDLARGAVERIDEPVERSEEHTSELQSLMRISYAVFCLKKKKTTE